jgi:hypothetical protein
VAKEVEVEHAVRVLAGEDAGGVYRQRRLPDPRHPLDDADPGGVPLFPDELAEFLVPSHELRGLGQDGFRVRDASRRAGGWPRHGRLPGKLGIALEDPLM